MENGTGLKMYSLLKMGIFHCHFSLPECSCFVYCIYIYIYILVYKLLFGFLLQQKTFFSPEISGWPLTNHQWSEDDFSWSPVFETHRWHPRWVRNPLWTTFFFSENVIKKKKRRFGAEGIWNFHYPKTKGINPSAQWKIWPNEIIFHQPRFPWNKGISLPQLDFGVRSCEFDQKNDQTIKGRWRLKNSAALFDCFYVFFYMELFFSPNPKSHTHDGSMGRVWYIYLHE